MNISKGGNQPIKEKNGWRRRRKEETSGTDKFLPFWSSMVALAVALFHCTHGFQSAAQLYMGIQVAPFVERWAREPTPEAKN